jgi:hypothetical protein
MGSDRRAGLRTPTTQRRVLTEFLDDIASKQGTGVKYLVGTTMFLNENASDDFPMWRQYDLKTGSKGPACDFNMRNFLGTDGSVFVFEVTNRSAGTLAKARDRNTCEALWTLPAQVDSLARIWRINATLVQLSDDGTELMSLVGPS